MSMINLSFKHGRTQEQARAQLESAVRDVCSQCATLVQRVDWSEDRNQVKITGTGFTAQLRVDAQEVHASADVPLLGGLLGNAGSRWLEGILRQNFPALPPK
jgi:hypothetical protein